MPAATGRSAEVTPELLAAGGASVWTPDAQAIVTIRTRAASSSARISITPLAPATLPPLPRLLPNGNAYRVEIETVGWEPDTAELLLVTPWSAATVYRWDGQAWTDLQATPGPDGRVAVPADGGGTFLAAATSLDGHEGWWASLTHDPIRPAVAGTGLALAAVAALRRGRSAISRAG